MTAKELYLEALECSVKELPVFLDFACSGDPQLRVEVEELLEGGNASGAAASGAAASGAAAPGANQLEIENDSEVA